MDYYAALQRSERWFFSTASLRANQVDNRKPATADCHGFSAFGCFDQFGKFVFGVGNADSHWNGDYCIAAFRKARPTCRTADTARL